MDVNTLLAIFDFTAATEHEGSKSSATKVQYLSGYQQIT